MPIPTKPVNSGCWSTSSTAAYLWASTAEPGQISGNEPDDTSDFILLYDPSKMHKSEIEAFFKHWLSHQENGDIVFAFSQELNACDNSMWLAVQLEALSDLGDSDLDSPAHLPENALAK